MAKHLDWGKCDWFTPKSSVLRKVYQGSEHATIAMGVLAPGHPPVPHRHRYEQICAIVKGKCDFHVGEEIIHCEADLEQGEVCWITIPPEVPHCNANPYEEPVYELEFFFPKRTEDREESREMHSVDYP